MESTFTDRQAKALETTIARGETLLADGYTIEPYADRPGVYCVYRPVNDTRPLQKGDTLWNDVDICNQDCTCEAFKSLGNCKHLIAVNKQIAEAARLMAPMLPAKTALAVSAVPVVAPVAPVAPVLPTVPASVVCKYGGAKWNKCVTADFG